MFYLLSRLVSAAGGFVYPAYASYKAIKANELAQLELWLMYWVVMGTMTTLESTFEWLFCWIPFYYEFKTILILWLTLPQIQGSTYLYVAHVHPFLLQHEQEIDAAVANAKVKAKQVGLEYLNHALARLREALIGSVASGFLGESNAQSAAAPDGAHEGAPATAPSSSSPSSPSSATETASGLYNLAGAYLRQYGPAAVAAGTVLLKPMNSIRAKQPPPRAGAQPSASSSTAQANRQGMRSLGVLSEEGRTRSEPSAVAVASAVERSRAVSMTKAQARIRRAELAAELAALNAFDSSPGGPGGAGASSSSESSPARPGQRIYHPRAVSAGHPPSLSAGGRSTPPDFRSHSPAQAPRDPVAARIERSFVGGYGFEEIDRGEVEDYHPPPRAQAMQPPPPVQGAERRSSGGWWTWGKNGQGEEDQAKKEE